MPLEGSSWSAARRKTILHKQTISIPPLTSTSSGPARQHLARKLSSEPTSERPTIPETLAALPGNLPSRSLLDHSDKNRKIEHATLPTADRHTLNREVQPLHTLETSRLFRCPYLCLLLKRTNTAKLFFFGSTGSF